MWPWLPIVQARRTRQLRRLVPEVVRLCDVALWSRVEHHAAAMPAAEALGYLWAHAQPVVRRELRGGLPGIVLSTADSELLVELSRDALVERLLQRALNARPAALSVRRAA